MASEIKWIRLAVRSCALVAAVVFFGQPPVAVQATQVHDSPEAGIDFPMLSGAAELAPTEAVGGRKAGAGDVGAGPDPFQVAQSTGDGGEGNDGGGRDGGGYGGGGAKHGPQSRPDRLANPLSPAVLAARTVEQEKATLARLKQLRRLVEQESANCNDLVGNGMAPQSCFLNVLKYFRRGLDREAALGSPVAIAAAPIVLEVRHKVRSAMTVQRAVESVREGVSKVRNISLVQSDDTVIAKLRSQQRDVVEQTLASIEVDMARAVGL